jgi:fermentation-respiration switch protein FrsA (DUF1100 family)
MYWLQRSFIYFPTRSGPIAPHAADLPAGQVHTIQVTADDGVLLHGWHILPKGERAARSQDCDGRWTAQRGLVLYFPGNAGNRSYRVDEFCILTRIGLHVFLVDYRGYGENAGRPSEAMLTADARAVWNYATGVRGVPPEQIFLYGESLGGAVAVSLASTLSEAGTPPAGLILRSTFSSLVDAGSYHFPWLPVGWALKDRYPSVEQIKKVTCPILQIHGTADSIVPISLGRRLFEAAPEVSWNGIAKRFVELPNADHNDLPWVADKELEVAIAAFVDQVRAAPTIGQRRP